MKTMVRNKDLRDYEDQNREKTKNYTLKIQE